MVTKAVFIYDDVLTQHTLSESHPMRPIRIRYTYELLESYGAFGSPEVQVLEPRRATDEEILSYHTSEYLNAVRSLSRGETNVNPTAFNFGPGDNPVYEGVYDSAAWTTGASMSAAELLISEEVDVAFNISGGLHHAMPGYASGFCVFNDPVIAINRFKALGMRVAYVDIDCHHGDGVQHAFYDTDSVLTISIHESGAFLFPGTGFTQETGTGKGRGYSVNVPLYPYTSDEVYLWAFREVVPPILRAFRPDVLITQLGIDTHYLDPITHLALTVQGFGEAVTELALLAPPRWLALGGGGYNLQAVARAWTLGFGTMTRQEFPNQIPESYSNRHDVSRLLDPEDLPVNDTATKKARAFAESTVMSVHRLVFPVHGIVAG